MLEPVSREFDRHQIRERATARFEQSLADDVRGLANRYRLLPASGRLSLRGLPIPRDRPGGSAANQSA